MSNTWIYWVHFQNVSFSQPDTSWRWTLNKNDIMTTLNFIHLKVRQLIRRVSLREAPLLLPRKTYTFPTNIYLWYLAYELVCASSYLWCLELGCIWDRLLRQPGAWSQREMILDMTRLYRYKIYTERFGCLSGSRTTTGWLTLPLLVLGTHCW